MHEGLVEHTHLEHKPIFSPSHGFPFVVHDYLPEITPPAQPPPTHDPCQHQRSDFKSGVSAANEAELTPPLLRQ